MPSGAKGFTLGINYYFIDENPEHCAYLGEVLQQSPYADLLDKEIKIITAPFAAVYERIHPRSERTHW